MREFGFTHMADYLPSARQKVGVRAVKRRIEELNEAHRQINFTLSADEYAEVESVMQEAGVELSDAGYWINSSAAFMAIIRAARPVVSGRRTYSDRRLRAVS